MENKSVTISIDSRESSSGIPDLLRLIPGVSIQTQELQFGDYVSGMVGIERKDAADLVASIIDRRIFGQVEQMKNSFDTNILLIEGNPYSTRSFIEPSAIDGLVSWIAILESFSVIFSENKKRTAELIYRIALHQQHGLGYIPPLRANKPKNPHFLSVYLIEGLPGVGPETARRLLQHFGSPRAVMNASVDQLCEVKGVGKGTAQKIVESLSAQTSF